MSKTSRDERLPSRKLPVHGVLIPDDGFVLVFDTVCTKDRKPKLATVEIHELLKKVWTDASAWLMGRYVILPDHIHYFAAPGNLPISLDNWVTYWKSQFTKSYRKQFSSPPPFDWQTDHWDTRLRTWERYSEKWEYVRYNPVRHGLVSKPEDWPFQGMIHDLRWD